ncbi:MAG: hypothetical protein JXR78_00160, partial [Victivallales bacterium]|nr:hypothetical protein [Victivallales bacterium]
MFGKYINSAIFILIVVFLEICTVRAADTLPFTMSRDVYAVPGIECNVYFANLILTPNSSNYLFEVDCVKGRHDQERWRYVPEDGDAGDYPLSIKVLNEKNIVVASGEAILHVIPRNAGHGERVNLLIIGDSLTDHNVYPQTIYDNLQVQENPAVTFLGTNWMFGRKPDKVAHEGYGGWTWGSFLNRWDENPSGPAYRSKSKFLRKENGKLILDFQYYCDTFLKGKKPDIITVMLGTNEMFGAKDNALDSAIDRMFNNADILIAEFLKVVPNAIIGIALTPPPAATQDAFGSNYQCKISRWQFRRRQFRLIERQIKKYASQYPKVSLIPVFSGLDCVHNFPVVTEAVNARNPQLILRQSNGVHPSKEGYRQIGDIFYCWLKYQFHT